jgi:hypothetical protein
MLWKVALALLIMAAPAAAQNSSTNCYQVGNTVQCDTRSTQSHGVNWGLAQPSQPAPDYNAAIQRGYEDSQRRRQMQFEEAERQRAYANAQAAQEVRQSVAASLRAGKCQEATDTALAHGEIELAAQAKNYCASPPTGK